MDNPDGGKTASSSLSPIPPLSLLSTFLPSPLSSHSYPTMKYCSLCALAAGLAAHKSLAFSQLRMMQTTTSDGSSSANLQHKLGKLFTSAALATTVLIAPMNIDLSYQQINHQPAISLLSITANALTENQQFISEVWAAVTSQYFDQTFNGLGMEGWKSIKKEALKSVEETGPDDDDIVNEIVTNMLSRLDDPYTRFLPRQKFETMTAYATGTSVGGAGIGVQLLEDARSKNVMVMAVTENSPASKAGLQAGDILTKIDGESVEGSSADVVAAKCRGEAGEKIDLDFSRTDDDGKMISQHVSLTRAKIAQNPIQASTFSSDSGKKIGLLRIPSFSTETVTQMVDGLRSVTSANVDAIAIDLRGNVGGFMPAGVDAAKLFLPAKAKIISEVDKSGVAKTYFADGIGSETSIPLYIIVDKRTASASEIFSAALQENGRAVIVSTSNSFGKGRIQNVKPLENGSGVAITRARYVTPNGRDIHGVGIPPDKKPARCGTFDSAKTCLDGIV
ncbi:hypothetical protein ACHAXN_006730 [Cyclotella atomus]